MNSPKFNLLKRHYCFNLYGCLVWEESWHDKSCTNIARKQEMRRSNVLHQPFPSSSKPAFLARAAQVCPLQNDLKSLHDRVRLCSVWRFPFSRHETSVPDVFLMRIQICILLEESRTSEARVKKIIHKPINNREYSNKQLQTMSFTFLMGSCSHPHNAAWPPYAALCKALCP